ncbi:hypothetical protein [Aeromonas caviae]|uniref:hypothetical protein n=1 Tax=Aeromonas caviae TaxID=648 RepID=UPI001BD36BF3|nr:hypothetical protein [Aeromonas caviae]MBS4721179.1 hypothetical protein [Aeromonas caviae]
MLDKIAYVGHEVTSIDYSGDTPTTGEGVFEVNIASTVDLIVNREDLKKDAYDIVSYPVKVNVVGYEGDEDDKVEVFDLEFIVESIFKFPHDISDQKQFVKDNLWYFENISNINIADVSQDLLRHTPFSSVKITDVG